MKIGQGNPAGAANISLIEQMQKAHAERLEETQKSGGSSTSFSVSEAKAPQAASTENLPPLDRKIVGIAERVLKGDLKDTVGARKEVLHAIVEERYGELVPASKRRQTVEALEQSLLDDPSFSKEVDHMLILAVRQMTPSS